MGLRNLSHGLLPFRRPPPAEPAWDALGHTALCAAARVVEMEEEPRIRGGKAGKAQVAARIEAKAIARKLLADWMEVRRLDGRPVDAGSSIADEQMAPVSQHRKPDQTVNTLISHDLPRRRLRQ